MPTAIFLIKNASAPRGVKTQRFQGILTVSKLLDKFKQQARPENPTFEPDDDKWTYAVKTTEYEALTE